MVPGVLGHDHAGASRVIEPCWGDRNGRECREPATICGLCPDCYVRIGGEAPVMLVAAPASVAFSTGCGRR